MSVTDRGDRILGAALLQGKLTWGLLADTLLQRKATPKDAEEAVRQLLEEGILHASDVAGLESTESGLPSTPPEPKTLASSPGMPQGPEASVAKLLTALAIPQWRQYRNLRFVGEGGMGRIYKGFDGTLRRIVALKFLRRMEPQLIARFMQEAQLQAGLEHPHICRVYEVGDWQGQAYLAMQFIKGETLDACAEQLTLREKVEVLEAVASAMHYAHRQGLIHRDLKPANIMVERAEGQVPHPYILDFGLARGLVESGFTVDGQVVGTYHFMAPEQARGATKEMDRRTDVYSLGATLYAVLADKPPFWDVEGVEVLNRTLHEEPVPLREILPDLPEDLETVVQKCLEKEPGRRYESARALAEDLRRWLDDEPILARKTTLRYRITKYARRHKALVAISAVALVAVLTAGGIAATSWAGARTRARYAQMFGQEAERLEALVRYTHLQPAHDIRPEVEQTRNRLAALERRAAQAGRLATGPAAYALGRARLALGEPEKGLPLLRQAWEGGLRIPEVALALGRAYGQAYQVELARARMLERPELREARVRELQQQFRKPALELLRQGATAALESPAYHLALMAFYEEDWVTAVRVAREACIQAPWHYEARRLEGLVLLEQAREARDPKVAQDRLQDAAQAFRVARTMAPSDPVLHLDEARTWRESLIQRLGRGEATPDDLQQVREATDRARVLDPMNPDPPALLADALRRAVANMRLGQPQIQAWEAEHLALSAEAIRLGPRHRESLLSRVGSLAQTVNNLMVQDGGSFATLEESLSLTQKGQRLFPEDPAFLVLEGGLAHRRMTLEMYRGIPPWASFERGLAAAGRYLALRPHLQDGYIWVAGLWVERAEYERTHGLDPEPSVVAALSFLDRAAELGMQASRLSKMRGDALLIRGQHRVRRGTGGAPSLQEARTAYAEALRLNPGPGSAVYTAIEASLWMGQEALDQGQDPREWVLAARTALRGADGIRRSDYYYPDYLEAQAALLEARWSVRQGLPAECPLQGARRILEPWGRRSQLAVIPTALAETHAWSYRSTGGASDLANGLAEARRAVDLDPVAAEPHLWMAVLHAEAHRRGVGSLEGARLELAQALQLDRNLEGVARRLNLFM